MAAITGFCGERFETMADYVRHLPHCVRCLMAHQRRG
jgi:hypothetical protein